MIEEHMTSNTKKNDIINANLTKQEEEIRKRLEKRRELSFQRCKPPKILKLKPGSYDVKEHCEPQS